MEPIWYRAYPPGIPTAIDPGGPVTVTALFAEAAHRHGERAAVHGGGATLTYQELDRLSDRFARYLLHELKLSRGERVAVMAPNITAYPVALLGVLKAGMVGVNVNPFYTAGELSRQLSDSGATVLVAAQKACETAMAAVAGSPLRHLVRIGGDTGERPASANVAEHDFATIVASAAGGGALPAVGPDDLALLQYTGGTTGRSKGAMLTHGNLVASVKVFEPFLGPVDPADQEVVVTATPLYHILGLCVNCLTFLRRGGLVLLIEDPRDLPGLVAAMREWRFSVITGVNTLFNGLLDTPGFADLDFSGLRLSMGGGTPILESVSRHWHAVTGQYICEGYGMSEAGGLTQTPRQLEAYRATIGLPVPSLDVSLRDESGREVAQGEPGEICLKGPSVMQGYWNAEPGSGDCFTDDGYFRTGDVAVMEEDGYLRIVDRRKDMILVSGFNVYPSEVEAVAASAPGVRECACIGVPDPRSGEAVKLFVVPREADLVTDAVLEHCRAHLARYKVPKQIRIVETLPKSPVGKILRRELRGWD